MSDFGIGSLDRSSPFTFHLSSLRIVKVNNKLRIAHSDNGQLFQLRHGVSVRNVWGARPLPVCSATSGSLSESRNGSSRRGEQGASPSIYQSTAAATNRHGSSGGFGGREQSRMLHLSRRVSGLWSCHSNIVRRDPHSLVT